MSCEGGDRDWSYVLTSQRQPGATETASSQPGFSPKHCKRSKVLLPPWFWTSSFQKTVKEHISVVSPWKLIDVKFSINLTLTSLLKPSYLCNIPGTSAFVILLNFYSTYHFLVYCKFIFFSIYIVYYLSLTRK